MSSLVLDDTVRDILMSRVYDVAIESPLERAEKLSKLTGHSVYLKREDLQPVHSFKLRGAYNKIIHLTDDERACGVITASAGNHAQGVALAAQKLGISALIIMPQTTPVIKVDAVKNYGADVELHGDNYSEAADYAKGRAHETKRTYVHPFDDPLVIAGQGTIGREIIEQLPNATHIFIPVGGGGLIAGIASYVKALRPDVKIIGVEPEDSNAMQASIVSKKRVTLEHVGIFADGVAVKQVGDYTYQIARKNVDDFITVDTDQICVAIKNIFEDTRSIVEPAGALAIAGMTKYELPAGAQAVAICSGANMTFERLQQVAERTLIGSGREAVFAVTLPEKPGALHAFCDQIVKNRSIGEFSYRLNKRSGARIFIGLTVSGVSDKDNLMKKMDDQHYDHVDLSSDDLAKEHIRHMIGGQAPQVTSEHIYEVTFPERPGALAGFLQAIGTNWNISLFHYRNAASDWSKVLIGFEADDSKTLEAKLEATKFEWTKKDDNLGIGLFLQ
ncbi:MAG TPA: threonine ammonia-lyase, biosynthetic [Candidatus Saccharimonadales bacterium]|nr:threonine ammonia-lyase, biosynthetic [Candidatus Saccharimonadales bacterium]